MSKAPPAPGIPRWRARLIVVLLALSPFILLEAVLWGMDFHSDARFRSFLPDARIFETVNGIVRLKPERTRLQFRTDPFPAQKPANTIRIFCLGDSVTLGWYSPGGSDAGTRLLETPYAATLQTLLKQKFPGVNFEVLNCGASGHASYRIQRLAREVLDYAPDIVTVMFGANEFYEACYYSDWQESKALYSSWLMKWKTLTLARDLLRIAKSSRLQQPSPPLRPETYDTHVPADESEALRTPSERRAMLAQTEHNLLETLNACKARGIRLVLMTEPANLLSRPSGAFIPRQDSTHPADRAFWKGMRDAQSLCKERKFEEALIAVNGALRELPDSHPGLPHLCFLRGEILRALGRYEEARDAFKKARDTDLMPDRATGDLNEGVLRFAQKHDLPAVDAEKAIEKAIPNGIPDDRIFYDNCHPNEQGHAIIAEALFQGITNTVTDVLQLRGQ